MANYLLPCTCGRVVRVTRSMAGQPVHCACGIELEVPTLRGLDALPTEATAADRAPARVWTDRQRVGFLLMVLGLAAGGVAGFLALRMPAAPQFVAQDVDPAVVQNASPDQINQAFDELKKGVRATQIITPEGREALEYRKIMTVGIRALLGLGACLLAAAAIFMVLPGKAAGR